jgi:hypothetical protein
MGKNDYRNNTNFSGGSNRAGVQPEMQKDLTYVIRTNEVEKYLQKKVDALYATAGKSDSPKIGIKSVEMSRSFYPFIVSLNTDCVENAGDGDTRINAFFQSDSSDQYVKLDPILYGLMKNYVYDKDDKKAFFSDAFRRELGLQKNSSTTLENLRQPKIMKFNGGKDEYIIFMIDPLRVFHDMLTSDTDKRDFVVQIVKEKIKKINTGEYQYKVIRSTSGGKNKKNKNNHFINEFEAKIKNQMRGNDAK